MKNGETFQIIDNRLFDLLRSATIFHFQLTMKDLFVDALN